MKTKVTFNVEVAGKMEKPVEFLTSQIKIDRNAVRLVRETREELV